MALGRMCLCSVVSSVGDMVSMLVMWLISFMMLTSASGVSCWVGDVVIWSLARRMRNVALLRIGLMSLWTVFIHERCLILFAERMGGVLVGKRVMAMRSPSAKRSCMLSACSIILFLGMILSDRVDDVFVGV